MLERTLLKIKTATTDDLLHDLSQLIKLLSQHFGYDANTLAEKDAFINQRFGFVYIISLLLKELDDRDKRPSAMQMLNEKLLDKLQNQFLVKIMELLTQKKIGDIAWLKQQHIVPQIQFIKIYHQRYNREIDSKNFEINNRNWDLAKYNKKHNIDPTEEAAKPIEKELYMEFRVIKCDDLPTWDEVIMTGKKRGMKQDADIIELIPHPRSSPEVEAKIRRLIEEHEKNSPKQERLEREREAKSQKDFNTFIQTTISKLKTYQNSGRLSAFWNLFGYPAAHKDYAQQLIDCLSNIHNSKDDIEMKYQKIADLLINAKIYLRDKNSVRLQKTVDDLLKNEKIEIHTLTRGYQR